MKGHQSTCMKLTESQTESLALLHASINNAIAYAEDLSKTHRAMLECMSPILNKLNWIRTSMELKLPYESRKHVRQIDHMRYDEMARIMSHMSKQQQMDLEEFATGLIKKKTVEDTSAK